MGGHFHIYCFTYYVSKSWILSILIQLSLPGVVNKNIITFRRNVLIIFFNNYYGLLIGSNFRILLFGRDDCFT